jgi:hypothetical protein
MNDQRILLCPHCHRRTSFQEQGKHWYRETLETSYNAFFDEEVTTRWLETTAWLLSCEGCSRPLLELVSDRCTLLTAQEWTREEVDRKVVYPLVRLAPAPVTGIPEEVARAFQEAADVLPISPSASAALLRLALEQLCVHLQLAGKDLRERLAGLVKQGLRPELEQALERVRVMGKQAVQPGLLDVRDDEHTVLLLFTILNLLVEECISLPAHRKRLANLLIEQDRAIRIAADPASVASP